MAMPFAVPRYALADLERFPDDGQRYELLGGVLLVTPSPAPAHQVVATRIAAALSEYLDDLPGAHVASPGAVCALPDTGLEPDVGVFAALAAFPASWREVRDWWLAVEVFSPSSRIYDRNFKRDAYLALDVREVWLVDLEQRAVSVARVEAPASRRSGTGSPGGRPNRPQTVSLPCRRSRRTCSDAVIRCGRADFIRAWSRHIWAGSVYLVLTRGGSRFGALRSPFLGEPIFDLAQIWS